MQSLKIISLHSAKIITPKMMIINSMVIDTITAVISLQQQTRFGGCLAREPPNPFTMVKCVELAVDTTSLSFGLWLVVTIESTVIVISRLVVAVAFLCCLFRRAKLAAVKFLPENVLYMGTGCLNGNFVIVFSF